jgi:hypothetical protein
MSRGVQQFPVWTNQQGQKFTSDYYIYGIGPAANGAIGAMAPGAISNQQITIQADSDFEWDYTTIYGEIDGATASPLPDNIDIPVTVLISDGGSGRQLFSQAIPVTSLAGLGREPYILPQKRIFMGKSTVNFQFTNFSGAVTVDNLFLCLHGRKIFSLN